MSQKRVELYKTRDFGEKINATVEYIRYNFKPLIKVVILIVAPIGLVASILFRNVFGVFFSMSSNSTMSETEAMSFMGTMGANYLALFALSLLTYGFMISAIFTYMNMRNESDAIPEVGEVLRASVGKVPGLIGLMILISIVTILGTVLFVLPGIYLSIVLSISIPIYMFEGNSIGDAFGKSFKLIREKWWSTLGLLFVSGLIAGMLGYIFAIPSYAVMIGNMLMNIDPNGGEPDPSAFFKSFTNWYSTAALAVAMIGSYVTYLIPIIALAFQYFNLSERVEGTGIRSQIEDFEKLS